MTASKVAMLPEFAGGHAGLVFFTTGDKGAAYGFETLNTGAVGVHTMFFVAGDVNGSIQSTLSAQQYIGTGVPATGASLVASNDMGFINLTKYHMIGVGDTGCKRGKSEFDLCAPGRYVRPRRLGQLQWALQAGAASPTQSATDALTTAGTYDTKATAIDGQMQGEIGKMPVGFYVSYATAPSEIGRWCTGGTYGNGNAFNLGPSQQALVQYFGRSGRDPG